MRGIHRWPVNSPHKGPVTRKMFPFDDVIMTMESTWSPEITFTSKVLDHITSLFSIIHATYMGLCVFSWPFSLMVIVRINLLYLIIIIKSEVWPIYHCFICLSIFLSVNQTTWQHHPHINIIIRFSPFTCNLNSRGYDGTFATSNPVTFV